jgi:hypothetical protein
MGLKGGGGAGGWAKAAPLATQAQNTTTAADDRNTGTSS